MKEADVEKCHYQEYGRKLRNFRCRKTRNALKKNSVCSNVSQKHLNSAEKLRIVKKHKTRGPSKEKRRDLQRNSQMMKILLDLKQKIGKVCAENPCCKYLSKKLFQQIMEGHDAKLELKQDQKKSLECNLIYSILKYLQWDELICYFKQNRNKVKVLKVSKFKQYILQGKMFEKETNPKVYQISADMVRIAVAKISDSNALLQNLLHKKAYTKLFQQSVCKYKQKMTVFMYKIHQFIEMLSAESRNDLQVPQIPERSSSFDMIQILQGFKDSEYYESGCIASRENTYEWQCENLEEIVGSSQLAMGESILLDNYFMNEINLTEMQKCSIFEDVNHDIQSQENSYPLHMI